jgi:ATP-dependent RNA helicase RhlB
MRDMGFIRKYARSSTRPDEGRTPNAAILRRHLHRNVMNLAKRTTEPAIVEIEPENVASDTVETTCIPLAGSDKPQTAVQ